MRYFFVPHKRHCASMAGFPYQMKVGCMEYGILVSETWSAQKPQRLLVCSPQLSSPSFIFLAKAASLSSSGQINNNMITSQDGQPLVPLSVTIYLLSYISLSLRRSRLFIGHHILDRNIIQILTGLFSYTTIGIYQEGAWIFCL